MKIEDLSLLKRIIEGALMAADKPLSRRGIKELFDDLERPDDELIDQALEQLQADTEGHGFELQKVASGYRYQVRQELSRWVGKLWKERAPRYSRALLETLSLIAYRQPITRGEIEDIRGVAVSTQIIKTLLEREWIKAVGHKDVPGRPAIYATTKQFLDYFNLRSLDQLPPLAEIRDLSTIGREFDIELPPELLEAEQEAEALKQEAQQTQEVPQSPASSDEAPAAATTAESEIEQAVPAGDFANDGLAALESWQGGEVEDFQDIGSGAVDNESGGDADDFGEADEPRQMMEAGAAPGAKVDYKV